MPSDEQLPICVMGWDNDTFMVGSEGKRHEGIPDSVFCPGCGWKLVWDWVRPDYRLARSRLDVSVTYDGARIVSERAREVLLACGADPAAFLSLSLEPGFHVLAPRAVVRLDPSRCGWRTERPCPVCELPESRVGLDPIVLAEPWPDTLVLARSDVLYGSCNGRHPLLLVHPRAGETMRRARLRGVSFRPVLR